MLRELAELGMAMTRELARRTLETPDSSEPAATPRPFPRLDPAEAFARLSRAVRLTLVLEARADEELAALCAGGAEGAAPTRANGRDDHHDHDGGHHWREDPPRDYPSAHRNQVRDAIYNVMNREITDLIPAQTMLDTLYERLTEGERYDTIIHRPFRETVEAICNDLGLHPDWSLWTGEGFAPLPEHRRKQWEFLWAPTRKRPPDPPEPQRRE